MLSLPGIRGVLLDVDGTLLLGDEAVPGASEALARLRASGLALRATTNTSRRSRAAVSAALRRAGLDVAPDEVLLPAVLARRRILASGRRAAALLVPLEARTDFDGVEENETAPDWVVVGDLGHGFTFERLNEAFRMLRAGASLLALHKNPYWYAGEEGWTLDAGAFVAALEYATGVTAEVVGKPSPSFFRLALEEIGLSPEETLVVGDDPQADGAGAVAAGCRVALVRTGKFTGDEHELQGLRPDLLLDSVADL